jgi:vacuolar-type H+-ATPase subunit H
MTTPPYGETDPLSTTPPAPQHASTPIANGLSQETDFDTSPIGTGTTDTGATDTYETDTSSDTGAVGSAKETAQDAVSSASEHGAHVAATAKDEATKVAAEAKEKATDLLADVKSQVDEQSRTQLNNLASKLGELADELENLVSGSEARGTVTDVAQQLADKTHQLSSHLESRQPMDLLDDVRVFARRRPGAFLAGAAVAGVVAGRLTRGAKASNDSDTSTTGTGTATGTGSFSSTTSTSPLSQTAPSTSTAPIIATPIEDVPDGQNMGGRQ